MNLLSEIGAVIRPVAELIDNLHTSDAEKAEARNKLYDMQAGLLVEALAYENKLLKARADIIKAEAQGQSRLQRSWRPVTMLTFLALVVCDSFGLLTFRLSAEAWTLLQIGLGGYVIGRSGEKIVSAVSKTRSFE